MTSSSSVHGTATSTGPKISSREPRVGPKRVGPWARRSSPPRGRPTSAANHRPGPSRRYRGRPRGSRPPWRIGHAYTARRCRRPRPGDPDAHRRQPGNEFVGERLENVGVQEQAGTRGDGLALAAEPHRRDNAIDGPGIIGIRKDDAGALATELERLGTIRSAAIFRMDLPVSVPPVNEIFRIPGGQRGPSRPHHPGR